MNGADLARLELAKRAYRASEPSATEVQRGVRRARLGLRRPKERRRWFGKGLVMVVLAVGGLAYAKPQAMGQLVTNAHEASRTPSRQLRPGGSVVASLPELPPGQASTVASTTGAVAAPASPAVVAQPARDEPLPTAPTPDAAAQPPKQAPRVAALAPAAPATPRELAPAAPATPRELAPAAPATPRETAVSQASSADGAAGDAHNVSDWGRVGQALARGDEGKALAVLSELSESDDQRTRDKADLGRAQLFMSNGNRDAACALARALTNRRAGSRIERQAQALLKTCMR